MGFGAAGDALFERSIALVSCGVINNNDPGINWQRVELATKPFDFRIESDRNDGEFARCGVWWQMLQGFNFAFE